MPDRLKTGRSDFPDGSDMDSSTRGAESKVPAVTLSFWIIKILATTLGETAGDTVSMTMGLGYLAGTAIFLSLLLILVACQIGARQFNPLLYWSTIIASTTAGTTMADFADRSLGIGYLGGSALLLTLVLLSLGAWRATLGSVAVDTVRAPGAEAFYWLTISLSQTLGTAIGDWAADDGGLGFAGGALIFASALTVIALLYRFTSASHSALFWAAFILTRPFGATVGDFFDKPVAQGGLDISRPFASAILAGAILLLILFTPQRPATRSSHERL